MASETTHINEKLILSHFTKGTIVSQKGAHGRCTLGSNWGVDQHLSYQYRVLLHALRVQIVCDIVGLASCTSVNQVRGVARISEKGGLISQSGIKI